VVVSELASWFMTTTSVSSIWRGPLLRSVSRTFSCSDDQPVIAIGLALSQ
jgi:hypothetical protein